MANEQIISKVKLPNIDEPYYIKDTVSDYITNETANITESQVTNLPEDLQNIREVAEGKTKSYVVNTEANPIFNTQENIVSTTANIRTTTGKIIPTSDLKIGDTVYVDNTDVPDRWVSYSGVPVDIPNLTDTVWVFNDNITAILGNWTRCNVEFSCNNIAYSYLVGYTDGGKITLQYKPANGAAVIVYVAGSGWVNETYKYITITGGTDVTNATVISWFKNQATLQSDICEAHFSKLETAKVPITSIQRNNIPLEPVNSTVNIEVPEATSDIVNDSGFITNTTARINESQVINLPDHLDELRAIAEGKRAIYVLSADANPDFDSDAETIEVSDSLIDTSGKLISLADLRLGDTVYVKEQDLPDRWVSKTLEVIPEYQFVEYLNNIGVGYVNIQVPTGGKYLSGDIVEIKYLANNFIGTYPTVFGSPASEIYYDTSGNLKLFGNLNNLYPTKVSSTDWTTITATYTADVTGAQFLFAYNSNGATYFCNGKIEYFKLIRDNTTIAELRPCYRTSDKKNGYLDIISNSFYAATNCETGPIIPAPLGEAVEFSKLETVKVPITVIKRNDVVLSPVNSTVNIEVPESVSELTNDVGYITNTTANITESQVVSLPEDLQNIREVAEGKTKNYVVSSIVNPIFDSQDNQIELTDPFEDINNNLISLSDLHVGDNIYVTQTNIPDRWVASFGGLPLDYQAVRYIQSDGTASIDLDYVQASNSARNILDFEFVEYERGGTLFGHQAGLQFYNYVELPSLYAGQYTSFSGVIDTTNGVRQILDFESDNGTITCSGKLKTYYGSYNGTIAQPDKSQRLLSSATGSHMVKIKVYSYKVYQDAILIRDLVPCCRLSDNTVGLYDKITSVFYTSNSGGLIAGPQLAVTSVQLYKLETAKPPVVDVCAENVSVLNTQTGIANITRTSLDLGNVDNTSDMDKPISTATQAAITNITDLIPEAANINNKLVAKSDISNIYRYCGSVDNYSDLPNTSPYYPTASSLKNMTYNGDQSYTSTNAVAAQFCLTKWSGTTRVALINLSTIEEESYEETVIKDSTFSEVGIGWVGASDAYIKFDVSHVSNNKNFKLYFTLTKNRTASQVGTLSDVMLQTFEIDAEIGDVYNIKNADPTHDIAAGDNVAWTGLDWDKLGGSIDTSNFVTKTGTETISGQKTFTASRMYINSETHFQMGGAPVDYAYGQAVGIYGKNMMCNTLFVPTFKYRDQAMYNSQLAATTWNLPSKQSGTTYTLATKDDVKTIFTDFTLEE